MKIANRIGQFLLSRVQRLKDGDGAQIITERGGLKNLPKNITVDSVLLVTTVGAVHRGVVKPFVDGCKEEEISVTLFQDVNADRTASSVERGVQAYVRGKCKAIAAIGGGEVINCAKGIAARVANPEKTLRDLCGIINSNSAYPTIYAVPTTAGTGCESTATAALVETANGRRQRFTINDFSLTPKVVLLDASLLTEVSPTVTAETGFIALTNAVEAYINKYSSEQAKSHALLSIKGIMKNLIECYKKGKDVEAREQMLIASCEAGIAVRKAFNGYTYYLSRIVGDRSPVSQGRASAVILPELLKAYGKKVQKPLSEIADELGFGGENAAEKADRFIAQIEDLRAKVFLPEKITGLRSDDFPILASAAIDAASASPTPVIFKQMDIISLLSKVSG